MRAVVQRVSEACVVVDGERVGAIGRGLLVYLGAGKGDGARDEELVTNKIATLRIFPDADGKMSLSVQEIGGEVLVVSQFTLYGDVRKGRRPGFDAAMEPVRANEMYLDVVARIAALGPRVATGTFRADMEVDAVNDGPVTILIDSTKLF
ncbi:MAG: D-tyrosyl-tRNA(Tyr) deacylase [Sandaracinaceae bacterium]|nr:D-tyrosyl-tRNA(Tyr) deacylase [Sandaracinaceae bacterium]